MKCRKKETPSIIESLSGIPKDKIMEIYFAVTLLTFKRKRAIAIILQWEFKASMESL